MQIIYRNASVNEYLANSENLEYDQKIRKHLSDGIVIDNKLYKEDDIDTVTIDEYFGYPINEIFVTLKNHPELGEVEVARHSITRTYEVDFEIFMDDETHNLIKKHQFDKIDQSILDKPYVKEKMENYQYAKAIGDFLNKHTSELHETPYDEYDFEYMLKRRLKIENLPLYEKYSKKYDIPLKVCITIGVNEDSYKILKDTLAGYKDKEKSANLYVPDSHELFGCGKGRQYDELQNILPSEFFDSLIGSNTYYADDIEALARYVGNEVSIQREYSMLNKLEALIPFKNEMRWSTYQKFKEFLITNNDISKKDIAAFVKDLKGLTDKLINNVPSLISLYKSYSHVGIINALEKFCPHLNALAIKDFLSVPSINLRQSNDLEQKLTESLNKYRSENNRTPIANGELYHYLLNGYQIDGKYGHFDYDWIHSNDKECFGFLQRKASEILKKGMGNAVYNIDSEDFYILQNKMPKHDAPAWAWDYYQVIPYDGPLTGYHHYHEEFVDILKEEIESRLGLTRAGISKKIDDFIIEKNINPHIAPVINEIKAMPEETSFIEKIFILQQYINNNISVEEHERLSLLDDFNSRINDNPYAATAVLEHNNIFPTEKDRHNDGVFLRDLENFRHHKIFNIYYENIKEVAEERKTQREAEISKTDNSNSMSSLENEVNNEIEILSNDNASKTEIIKPQDMDI